MTLTASTTLVWRIATHTLDYAATDLSGGGAKSEGGRWNSVGMAMSYASSTIALATLETLAHRMNASAIRNAFLVEIRIPPAVWRCRQFVRAADLDVTWLADPPGMTSVKFGDRWLRSMSCLILMVPSVLVPEEYNVLINPAHADSRKLRARAMRQYIYDPRL